MFDYYNLEPLLMWIHSAMCSLMPEWLALTIEGIAVGVFIMVMYAVLAIILIYMEGNHQSEEFRQIPVWTGTIPCHHGVNPDILMSAMEQGRRNPAYEYRYILRASGIVYRCAGYSSSRMEQ